MTEITMPTLTLILSLTSVLGVIFAVYHYFKNPQIKTDQTTLNLANDITSLKKEIVEIKETHLRSVEGDLKTLAATVQQLDRTVVKLTTIIEERIPKASSNLTPPGM